LCTEEEGLLDYLHFHYCTMRGAEAVSVTLLVLVLLTTFYLLGETAEEYFCPVVRRLTQDLRLAPSTAGVTLLALVRIFTHRLTFGARHRLDPQLD
jgi:sodium/potassium/calcium exchanger 6